MNISFVLNGVKVIEIEIPNGHIEMYDNLEPDDEIKVLGIECIIVRLEKSFNKCEYDLITKELYLKHNRMDYICDVCSKEFYKPNIREVPG